MMEWSKKKLEEALSPTMDNNPDVDVLDEGDELEARESTSDSVKPSDRVDLPTIEELLNPLLLAMHSLGGSATNQEIEEKVIQKENITEEQLAVLTRPRSGKIGKPIVIRSIGFAKTYLKDFGILENPATRTWSLTELGKQTFHVDPDQVKQIYDKHRKIRKAEREAKKEAANQNEIEENSERASISDFLTQLEATLRQRRIRRPEGSYTAELFVAGPARIAQKVGEEALEVIIAALHESRERQISEVADLLVHTLILLVELNIPLEEVLAELQRRHEARQSRSDPPPVSSF